MPKKPILEQNSRISNKAPAQVFTSKKMPAKVSKDKKVLAQVSTSKKGPVQTSTSKEVPLQATTSKKAPAHVFTGKKAPTYSGKKKEFSFKAHIDLSDDLEDSNDYEASLNNSAEDTQL
ncbi:hypothetical protein C2G38_2039306 [Gigaspora rosea]|uniref:Uncharacterized protein n=1 Tax=Gigaspora rosea TaxID=44941 RepID=A0A397V1R6_9GLOM|nr:hypothetical protein C2G38_2039306 [Gigaspora rosea]